MKKIFSIIILMLLALPLATIAADNVASSTPYRLREEIRNVAHDLRASTTQEIKGLRKDVISAIQQKRGETIQAIEQARIEFKKAIEQKRIEIQNKIKAKRDELKLKLQKIKDERKRQVVEKIDAQLDALSARWTDHFGKVLEQIETVLDRVAARADETEKNGKNVAGVSAAIESARSAITASRSAVQTQTGKTYTIVINQEGTLKQDVGVARQALHTDLESVQATVKAARDAVHQAAVALAQINGVNPNGETTATSTTSTSTQQ